MAKRAAWGVLGPDLSWRVVQVPPDKHREGVVWHTVGYPLDARTYGGSFLYHMADHQVALG